MAKKGNRQLIRMVNPETGTFYVTDKNRVNSPDKMEIKKFDKKAIDPVTGKKGAHVTFVEKKVK